MKNEKPDIIDDVRDEVLGMAKGGMQHPSTRPVLAGAAIGALGGALLIGSWPIGLAAGAGIAIWSRVKK